MAFLSTPGTERLYSGVTNNKPCAAAISALSRLTGALVGIIVLIVERQVADLRMLEREVGRASFAIAWASFG